MESPAICHDGERRNKSKVRFMMGTLFSVTVALPVIICEGIALEHGLFDENLPMTAWSITMVKQGKQHIEEWWLERWLKFLRTYCCMGAFALEVGDKEEHLHIQGAVVVHAASDASAKAAFDRFLKWFLDIPAGQKDGDKGYKLQVKPCNKGAGQTIMYMIGYVLKQLGESHFKFVCLGFSPQDLQRAVRAYARVKLDVYGGKTVITRKNMMSLIYKFWFKLFAPLNMDTCRIIVYMLTNGTHALCQTFVVSYGAHGIHRERLDALWCLLTRPTEATKRLVKKAVFDEDQGKRGGFSGLHNPRGRSGPPSTWQPGDTDSDSDEYEDVGIDEVRLRAMTKRDVPIRGPEDNADGFEYPNGCRQALHCGGLQATINEVYLREHGFAENDGEAEEQTPFVVADAAEAGSEPMEEMATASDREFINDEDEEPAEGDGPEEAGPSAGNSKRPRRRLYYTSDDEN